MTVIGHRFFHIGAMQFRRFLVISFLIFGLTIGIYSQSNIIGLKRKTPSVSDREKMEFIKKLVNGINDTADVHEKFISAGVTPKYVELHKKDNQTTDDESMEELIDNNFEAKGRPRPAALDIIAQKLQQVQAKYARIKELMFVDLKNNSTTVIGKLDGKEEEENKEE